MHITEVFILAQEYYLFYISHIGESQSKGGRPHGSSVAEGASAVKLIPGRLVHVAELRGRQLLQHLDHSGTVAASRGCAVLLREPVEVRNTRV